MVSNSNRARIFADVVSVDAWHRSFDSECAVADLHADVIFQEARVGGEAASPVRFRLRLRRAEVVIVIPETETSLRVLKDSVARDALDTEVTSRTRVARKTAMSGEAGGSLSAAPSEIKGSLKAGANAGIEETRTEETETESTQKLIVATQSKTIDGHYRWQLSPTQGEHLHGRGWDAATEPRLKVEDRRSDRTKGISPTIHVEVRCKREDLIIEDLHVKDEARWKKYIGRPGFEKRMAAAESYIRSRLSEEGLEFGELNEDFADITIASVICDPT